MQLTCPSNLWLLAVAATPNCCQAGCCNPGPGCNQSAPSCQQGCSSNAASCGLPATTSCLGCPPGTFGSISPSGWNCTACSNQQTCVGLLDSPLVDFTNIPAAAAAACPLLATLAATPQPGTTSEVVLQGYTWLLGIPTVDGVVLGALVFAAAVAGLLAYSMLLAHAPGALAIRELLKKFDINNEPLAVAMDASGAVYVKCYATKVAMVPTAGGRVVLVDGRTFVPLTTEGAEDKVKRPQGGACALLSLTALATLILVLVLQREAGNTLSVLAANFLRASDAAFALTLPFYKSPSWGAGVQVRVMAAGNAGACGKLSSWAALGFKGGAPGTAAALQNSTWSYSVVANCGGTGVAQHVFRCSNCVFTSSSALQMTFDWSCQALYVEAGSLDAGGVVYTDVISPQLTSGSQGLALSGVQTYDGLYLNIQNDTFGSSSARGYALAPGSNANPSNSLVKTFTASSGLTLYSPSASLPAAFLAANNPLSAGMYDPASIPSVTLTMNLPLNTLFTVNTLSQKVSSTALLSSIIGLTGIVGLFGCVRVPHGRGRARASLCTQIFLPVLF